MQFNRVNGYPGTNAALGSISVPLKKIKTNTKSARSSEKLFEDPGAADLENPLAQSQSTSAGKSRRTKGFGMPHDKKPHNQKPDKNPGSLKNLLIQLLLAILLIVIGVALLVCTVFVIYRPIRQENDALSETRMKTRMELNALISEVLPSMSADDELGEMILRSLEMQKAKFKGESVKVADEIEQLRASDEVIGGFLAEIQYQDADFHSVIVTPGASETCLQTVGAKVDAVDAQLQELGVPAIREQIAELKGTTTTVTREDENGETITETVVTGGLIPEAQAKRDALQKQYDEVNGKLEELDAYLEEIDLKIVQMYSRLETEGDANDRFARMKAITEYVKQNPEDNMFMQDTAAKLASFTGESREEDDILFLAKIEAETGIRMPTINYGQDYQLAKLSNGMLLCYEVYSIPYYATYEGLKNLIAYFNANDDFYASLYTLSIQYNPQNQSIQGNVILMHYYLLSEDAEYIPPTIDEVITPGIDGIFGDVTDNGGFGPMSDYSPEDLEKWMTEEGLTLEQVRDRLKSQGYPETELLWILKKKYRTEEEIKGFLEEHGDEDVDYGNQMEMLSYLQQMFPNTKLETLIEIYKAELPEQDLGGVEVPTEPEDTTDGEQTEGGEPTDRPTDQPAGGEPVEDETVEEQTTSPE